MKPFRRVVSHFTILVLLSLSVFQLPNSLRAQVANPAPTPAEVKIDPRVFDAYVGQYQEVADPDIIFSFFREGERLYGQVPDQERFEIFPSSETSFFLKITNAQVDFVRDAAGRVASIVWHQGGKDYPAKKVSDRPVIENVTPFKRSEVMIPMRDGTRLYTVILTPQNQIEPIPIILNRTPYGVKSWNSERLNNTRRELVADGYIFAFQDIRGRYDSEGRFVMVRPPRDKRDAKSVDESTDTYDTVDWLIKNLPKNNGRVGIMGVSYDGWLSTMALLDPHPALRASSPQAPMTDVWMGDDFFHNGAFRQTYGHEYVKAMESAKGSEDISFGKVDAYDWYFALKTLSTLTTRLGGKLPTWNDFVAHPSYDSFWQKRATQNYLDQVTVPTLVVGGWWDQEDLFGPLATYQALEKHDSRNMVFLVEGPWNHGGWRGQGRRLAEVDFGSNTGKYFRKNIEAPWFAYYLKDKGTLKQAEATIFQSGSNRWMTYDAWSPRRNLEKRELYLQANGGLSFDKPEGSDEFDQYVSDPSNPVAYRKRPVEATYDPNGSKWFTWLAQDQRFLGDRKDVLSWQTEPLKEDVTITGDIIAHLFASTTGTDGDWVVKLIDVYPASDPKIAGYQLMVASEIFRGRYRKSFEKPEAIVPDQVSEYTIDLHGNDYSFLKGHRIMVQVQSTWFPLYDRNPQKFVENIFLAKEGDYQTATQRIYRSAKYPTHLRVSVAMNKN
ncbi:MAG TPA: CocE/NonD family hydrolase [Pyrinomonadaceae bacterium]|nr:CocE/NonD family hydrolase [Pyrinomonadaceae bacterium]